MNAKGIQKLLIASSVTHTAPDSVEHELEDTSNISNRAMRRMTRLTSKQLSDYEEPRDTGNAVSGKITLNNKSYLINGMISYDDDGTPSSYKGSFYKDKNTNTREFSQNLQTKILNIFNSPYRKVSPGEQTTSTFHKIVLDDPNEWYQLDKSELFRQALYTLLYFKRIARGALHLSRFKVACDFFISQPPDLYDEKVDWFGPDCINMFVYHFARLALNNRIYDKFNGIEVTQLKIAYGEYIPKSLIYNGKEYSILNGDKKGIFDALLLIDSENQIFTQDEADMLNSLYIRSNDGIVPKIELRHD